MMIYRVSNRIGRLYLPYIYRGCRWLPQGTDEPSARYHGYWEDRGIVSAMEPKRGNVHLSKDAEKGIATVVLDDPQTLNAISGRMIVELQDILDELAKWTEGKGLILRGAGGTFTTGGHLQLHEADDQTKKAATRFSANLASSLLRSPLITVAALDGMAIAIGAELALACDFRVATSCAKIGLTHSRMGLSTLWGGSARLVRLVGRPQALDMLLTGKIISGDEALKVGIVQHVCSEQEDVCEAGRRWLLEKLPKDAKTVQAVKQVVNYSAMDVSDDISSFEQRMFLEMVNDPVHLQYLARRHKH